MLKCTALPNKYPQSSKPNASNSNDKFDMATLTYAHKASESPIVGSAKDLRAVSTTSFRRAASVEMVQLLPRTGKNLADAGKLISPDPGNTSNDRQLTSIQPDVVLRLCQETHKTKVFEIDLSGNAIKKIENIEGFSHLRIIDLACNQIDKIENLAKNAELRELRLYANRIARIENLEQLKKLSVLKLQQNNIEQIGEGLSQQKLLEVLRLDSNQLRFLKPNELLPLQGLRVLNISRNQLTDISSVANLVKLETLDASHNNIPVLPNLKKCTCLQEVNLSSNRLDSLAGLAENLQLITLDASNNALKTLRSLGQQCKKQLENVHVAGNILETIDDLPTVAPKLEILDISKNRLNNAEKLLTTLQQFESLMELKCSQNPVFDSISPSEIHQVLVNVEIINGVNFARRTFAPTGDPAGIRPQTPMMSARGERSDDIVGGGGPISAAVLRPKTATTGITIRQLDSIFNNLDGMMENLERSFLQSFEKVVTTLETEAPHCEQHGESMCKSCLAGRKKQQEEEEAKQAELERQAKEEQIIRQQELAVSSSPVPSSSGSSSTASSNKTPQAAKNALTRRLEQARNYSMKMMAQSGGNKSTSSTSIITTASKPPPQPRLQHQRQNSATRNKINKN